MSSVQSTYTCARQFVREHAVQVRGDALNLQQLRQSNYDKFQQLKQQNAMITNLKKALLEARRKITSTTSIYDTQTTTTSSSSPVRIPTPSSSSTSLCSSETTTSSTLFDNQNKLLKFIHIKNKGNNRIQIIDIYLKAINAVQKHYKKVVMIKIKDEFIRLSTMPVITYSNDDSSAAYGLFKYPDRLLHAANLEDSIDRCLAKQQCIIHEASTKMPPSICLTILPPKQQQHHPLHN